MKKITVVVVCLLIAAFAACSKKKSSVWLKSPVTVDGFVDDWKSYPLIASDIHQAAIGLCNDASSLYLMLSFTDNDLAHLFRMNGITVWFGKDGNKEKNIGMIFVPERQPQKMSENTLQMEALEKNAHFDDAIEPDTYFIMMDERIQPTSANLPVAEAKMMNGTWNIEIKIPINRNTSAPFALDVNGKDLVELGFEIALSDEMRDKLFFDRSEMLKRQEIDEDKGRHLKTGRLKRGATDFRNSKTPSMVNELKIWLSVKLAKVD